jgi:hypothetical protein
LVFAICLAFAAPDLSFPEEEGEETYNISLVQTAESDKEVHEIENKKVLAENYTVKKDDHIWQILRSKGLLDRKDLPEILSVLKKLNRSLTDLDMIRPGDSLIIPLTIVPLGADKKPLAQAATEVTPIESLEEVPLENYTVSPGDSIIKVVTGRYNIPDQYLYNEYLELVRKLNPSIDDINKIYPGQKIRIPVYSPQIVRLPLTPSPKPVEKKEAPMPKLKEDRQELGRQLGRLFALLGEEWVQRGEHFLPLRSGGQINLNANVFPILRLSSGRIIIVDLSGQMPEKMKKIIESNWANYLTVHLSRDDNLRTALGEILPACGYRMLSDKGDPLKMTGDIPILVNADWIVEVTPTGQEDSPRYKAITLLDTGISRTPAPLKSYLSTLGLDIIEYPPASDGVDRWGEETDILPPGEDVGGFIERILDLVGRPHSSDVDIPIYQAGEKDFNIIVKADFLFNQDGRECLIDYTGLDPEVTSLLEENGFRVLPIAGMTDPQNILLETLSFIGNPIETGPHHFQINNREKGKDIRLTISGSVFRDKNGKQVFATPRLLPNEIEGFLSWKGYRILNLAPM